MRAFQVSSPDPEIMRAINDALRQVRDAFDEVVPILSVVLSPEGRALPLGWQIADGTNNMPDLRASGMSGHIWIVRRG